MESIEVFSPTSDRVVSLFNQIYLPQNASTGARSGYRTVSLMSYSSSSEESEASFELPENLNSVACLEFVGFSALAAEKIFATWEAGQRGPLSIDSSLLDEALCHIKANARHLDAWDNDDDWQTALSTMGISMEMCERILDPKFAAIRLTGCACSWATDSVLIS